MKIILSTRNPSKTLQIQQLFSNGNTRVQTLEEVGIKGEAVEDGTTLEENAFKKADFAQKNSTTPCWTIADDTGLFIPALGNEPGIHAARWPDDGSPTTTEFILEKMKGITDRRARFETTVVVLSPNKEKYVFNGSVEGTLLSEQECEPQPKMPYSPLFVPNGQQKCWAEMTTEEENAISHRGIAFRKAIEFLEENN